MKISINEIQFKISQASDKDRPDLLAHLSIKFIDDEGRFFSCSGFTIRKSKYDGNPYIALPSKKVAKGFFKFNLVEKSLWKKIEKEALDQYDYETIPISK
jgi:hypothetical protein